MCIIIITNPPNPTKSRAFGLDSTVIIFQVQQVNVPPPGVTGEEVSMNHSEEMDRAYEAYFESLAEGEEVLSFAEFSEALSSSPKPKE